MDATARIADGVVMLTAVLATKKDVRKAIAAPRVSRTATAPV